jgi:hypothetical protein
MPTVIDSLFLELGIDTAKFSKDQKVALEKIQEFESRTKRAAKGSRDALSSVSEAFHGLADNAGQFSGPLNSMSRGLGMLLTPARLLGAAVGLVGYEMWDLNKVMTANNAAIARQAQLTNMGASAMWSWAEAAKTVGANPMEVAGGISSLQTAITGMGIGAGNATPQLIALARLGVPFNFSTGADIGGMFTRVNALAAARGFQNLGALRALTGPVMNDAEFALATNPNTTPADIQKWISDRKSVTLGNTLTESLKSQEILGKLGISKDILAETAYGGEQGLMQAVVELLTKLLDLTNTMVGYLGTIAGFFGGVANKVSGAISMGRLGGSMPSSVGGRQAAAMGYLMRHGLLPTEAAAVVGNLSYESGGMNPLASNKGHLGLAQWDASRQSNFARFAGYRMGDSSVSPDKQFSDQLAFLLTEPEFSKAHVMMSRAHSLSEAARAFMDFDEKPGLLDASAASRFGLAQQALASYSSSSVQSSVNNNIHIRTGNIVTQATDGTGIAKDFSKELNTHPLLGPLATQTVTLASRGSQ